jgi:site-specific recombinase XerD
MKMHKMMNRQVTPSIDINALAYQIAKTQPQLSDLNMAQLEKLAQIMTTQRLSDELGYAVNVAGIDYDKEKALFLKSISPNDSACTKATYKYGMKKLEMYASRNDLKLLSLTPSQADQYILSLRQEGRAANSVRLDVSIASSFFTFISRRHKAIDNPFRGTRAKPGNKAMKKVVIPIDTEIKVILDNVPLFEKAIITCLYSRGFRVGALPALTIWGTKFNSRSKQVDIAGEIPNEAIMAIKAAGLNTHKPFSGFSSNALKTRVKKQMKKLYEADLIRHLYSSHSFRHYYAVTEYKKNNDLYRVSKLLFHTSLSVTERYLQGLGVVEI